MEGKDMTAAATDHQSNSLMSAEPEAPAEAETPDDSGEVSRVEIEIAANGGFVVTCYHKQSDAGPNQPSPYLEPTKYAVSSREELDAVLDDKLGAPAEGEQPPAPAPGGYPASV